MSQVFIRTDLDLPLLLLQCLLFAIFFRFFWKVNKSMRARDFFVCCFNGGFQWYKTTNFSNESLIYSMGIGVCVKVKREICNAHFDYIDIQYIYTDWTTRHTRQSFHNIHIYLVKDWIELSNQNCSSYHKYFCHKPTNSLNEAKKQLQKSNVRLNF